MKKMSGIALALLAVGVFVLSGVCHAVSFTVSDVSFTNPVGYDERLEWSLTAIEPGSFDLEVGGSYTFTYGTFNYLAGFNKPDQLSNQFNDNDDRFDVSFMVMPPDPATDTNSIGVPDGVKIEGVGGDYVFVNFPDSLVYKSFANGGIYTVTFLDSDHITGLTEGQSVSLRARITLLSDSTPVPEPGTLLLFGSALVGLAGLRLRRKARS